MADLYGFINKNINSPTTNLRLLIFFTLFNSSNPNASIFITSTPLRNGYSIGFSLPKTFAKQKTFLNEDDFCFQAR
jgi:hypothetical protein